MIRYNYSIGQLKRIFLDRIFRELGVSIELRLEERIENDRRAWYVAGNNPDEFRIEDATRNAMYSFGYLGDEREIEIHRGWIAVIRSKNDVNEKLMKRLVEDNGSSDQDDSFEEGFDIRGDILWVYRNFSRVVTVNDTGDVFFDWENAVGKAPTAGALMYMEMASRNKEEFLTKIVPKILFNSKRAVTESRNRDRMQDNRINNALEPPKLMAPRMEDMEAELDILTDSVSPPFIPDAPAPDENGKVIPDYEFEPIPRADSIAFRRQEEAERKEREAEQERLEAEEWIQTRSQIPAEDLESTPLMDALKKFHSE